MEGGILEQLEDEADQERDLGGVDLDAHVARHGGRGVEARGAVPGCRHLETRTTISQSCAAVPRGARI